MTIVVVDDAVAAVFLCGFLVISSLSQVVVVVVVVVDIVVGFLKAHPNGGSSSYVLHQLFLGERVKVNQDLWMLVGKVLH